MQSFAIWVTSSCNMQCSYCYEGKEKENFNMSQQTLKDSISFIEERMEHMVIFFCIERVIFDAKNMKYLRGHKTFKTFFWNDEGP